MKPETLKKANELITEIKASESLVNHLETLKDQNRKLYINTRTGDRDDDLYLDHEYVFAMLEIAEKRIESAKNEFEAL